MIKFALRCANGHGFESWFQSGAAFEAQTAAGLVACPACQTAAVEKAIMAPALARGPTAAPAAPPEAPAAPPGPAPAGPLALLSAADGERRALIVELRRRILEQSTDLGGKFADEALKIHQGLAPDRAIHGEASFADATRLMEEGVFIMPIPRLPGELN